MVCNALQKYKKIAFAATPFGALYACVYSCRVGAEAWLHRMRVAMHGCCSVVIANSVAGCRLAFALFL